MEKGSGVPGSCRNAIGIDSAIDGAHLTPDDVRHRFALGGRRHRDVGRTRTVGIEGLEGVHGAAASAAEAVRVIRGGEVARLSACSRWRRRRAIEVPRPSSWRSSRHRAARRDRRPASRDEPRLVRAMDHGTGDRVVDDRQLRCRLVAAHRRLDGIGTDVQSRHDPNKRFPLDCAGAIDWTAGLNAALTSFPFSRTARFFAVSVAGPEISTRTFAPADKLRPRR